VKKAIIIDDIDIGIGVESVDDEDMSIFANNGSKT